MFNHSFNTIFSYNTFGSIDIKQEHSNISDAIVLLRTIIENGGMNTGGLNIYLPIHKGPFEAKDLIESFVVTLDVYAKALRIAVKLINDVQLNKSVQVFRNKHFCNHININVLVFPDAIR